MDSCGREEVKTGFRDPESVHTWIPAAGMKSKRVSATQNRFTHGFLRPGRRQNGFPRPRIGSYMDSCGREEVKTGFRDPESVHTWIPAAGMKSKRVSATQNRFTHGFLRPGRSQNGFPRPRIGSYMDSCGRDEVKTGFRDPESVHTWIPAAGKKAKRVSATQNRFIHGFLRPGRSQNGFPRPRIGSYMDSCGREEVKTGF